MAVFDKRAVEYDKWYKTKLGKFVDEVETECALSMLSLPEGSRILDIGCGTGNFSIKLAKMNYKVVGIDISEDMLDLARRKAAEQSLDIEFMNMDANCLEFEDESFDGVISMATFEFFEKPEKVIEELFRIVKPEGPIIIGTINKDSDWGRLYTARGLKEDSIFRHALLKTPEDMKKLKPKQFVKIKECLYIPPETEEDTIDYALEEKLKHEKSGGFICLLWIK